MNLWEQLTARQIARIFVLVLLFSLLAYLTYLVRSTLVLVGISVFLAIALGPAVDLFSHRRIPRAFSILLVYGLIGLVIFGIGLLFVPPLVNQVEGLSGDIPTYLQDARKNETLRKYDNKYKVTQELKKQAEHLPERLGDAVGTLQAVTVGAFSAVVQLATVLTLTFFLLLDGKRIFAFLLKLLRKERQPRVEQIAMDIYRSTAGYVAGNLLISLMAGLTAYITLTLMDVPFAIPLAILMAFLDLIPLVGATIGGVIIGLVTLAVDFPTATIIWVVVLFVYQQVENNLLQPLVYRKTVDVAPVVVIISILIGTSLLGVLGALVAIPVAAAVQIVVRDYLRLRENAVQLAGVDDIEASSSK